MNDRSSVNDWSSVDNGSSVDNWGSVNNRSDADSSNGNRSFGIDSSTVIGDLSYVAIDIVGVVVDMLDPAVRKSYRVGTLVIASSITGLGSIEVGGGVVVSHGVVVCVGGDLVREDSSNSVRDGVSSNKSMSYKSVSCDNTMTGSMESV